MATGSDAIPSALITGVVLAGGRGTRMGGIDKGLVPFDGEPMALRALRRLQAQVSHAMISANRHLDRYRRFGVPVWPDMLPDYAGPLAGISSALHHCRTPYLVTVPCDVPLFPDDLVARLAQAMAGGECEIAMACSPEDNRSGQPGWRKQPAFCLLRASLLPNLLRFTEQGGRKIDGWVSRHATTLVPFETAQPFFNVNSASDLRTLKA